MKQIYSIKASLLENKRLFKGTLTIYDTGCEFISFTRHRTWMWEDISALQAHKSTTTVSGLFGKNHEQPCFVLSFRDFSATFLFPEQQIAYAVHKINVTHATTPVKQVENAHIDEDAHKVELAEQEEATRKAEIAKQEEAARKVEIAKQEEATRKAEIARQEEAARKAEIARQEEATRKAEIARQEEAARKAEIARQEEAARKAEIARQEETARKAEIARREEARTTALIELKCYVREELAWCKQNIPASFVPVEQSLMNPAIVAKRNGNYLESLQAYFHLIHQENMIAPGIAHAMFKVLVAAGALRDAFDFVDYIVIVTSKVPAEITLASPVTLFIDMLYTSANQLWSMATKKNYQGIIECAANFAHCPITDIEMDEIAQHSQNATCTPYDAFVALHHGETQFADFIHLIVAIRKQTASSKVSDLLTFISKAAGFEKKYRRNDTAPCENKEDPWANISMLITNTVGIERNANDNLTLAAYLDEISTFTNMDEVSNQDSVNMMSIHSAKGLEFPVVFCVGWNENIFPDWRNQHGSILEEERRIAYVAYTRAQHELYVISATYSGKNGHRNNTSRFVWEMKEEVIE